MEEYQKRRTPLKLKFKIKRCINGGFQIDNCQFQENTENKKLEFFPKLQKQSPSSSMEEKGRIENRSSSNINSNSRCSAQYTFSSCGILVSSLPQWSKRAKRCRKSFPSSLTSSVSSLSSKEEKKEEPSLCEKEAIEALLMLADGFPKKKRKIEDTDWVDCAEDQSKKGRRIEGETRVYRDGFLLDTPILSSSASGKFTCAFCGKSFSCHQALGGHKSKCKINCSKGEVAEFALQDLMRIEKNQIDESSSKRLHKCKICYKTFSTGQALGGHQKSHRIVQVEPHISMSSVSTSMEINKEEFIYPINNTVSAVVVQEAKDDLTKTKITLFDLNEHPVPEEEDELLELRLLSPTSILDF